MVNPEKMPPFPEKADETSDADTAGADSMSLVTLHPRSEVSETQLTSDQVVDNLTAAARAGDPATTPACHLASTYPSTATILKRKSWT